MRHDRRRSPAQHLPDNFKHFLPLLLQEAGSVRSAAASEESFVGDALAQAEALERDLVTGEQPIMFTLHTL